MSDSRSEVTGGCQCGAIRFAVHGPIGECNICHCRMCQKAGGGPFMVFINVPTAAVTWKRGRRALFRSSSMAARGFCRDCGTPLTYERQPASISLSHGALDDPGAIVPTSRLASETVLPWSEAVGAIPIQPVAEWLATLGPVTVTHHQHPDHDA